MTGKSGIFQKLWRINFSTHSFWNICDGIIFHHRYFKNYEWKNWSFILFEESHSFQSYFLELSTKLYKKKLNTFNWPRVYEGKMWDIYIYIYMDPSHYFKNLKSFNCLMCCLTGTAEPVPNIFVPTSDRYDQTS